MRYDVHFTTDASLTVTVKVTDEDLQRLREEFNVAPNELPDEDTIKEFVLSKAYEGLPRDVCAQYSGWGQPWSLDLGDWNLLTDREGVEDPNAVTRVDRPASSDDGFNLRVIEE
jgi:hypothetical protein